MPSEIAQWDNICYQVCYNDLSSVPMYLKVEKELTLESYLVIATLTLQHA